MLRGHAELPEFSVPPAMRAGKRGGDHPSLLAVLPHSKVVNAAYFSPVTGRKILTTCIDNRLRVWDLVTHARFPRRAARYHTCASEGALSTIEGTLSAEHELSESVQPFLKMSRAGRLLSPEPHARHIINLALHVLPGGPASGQGDSALARLQQVPDAVPRGVGSEGPLRAHRCRREARLICKLSPVYNCPVMPSLC